MKSILFGILLVLAPGILAAQTPAPAPTPTPASEPAPAPAAAPAATPTATPPAAAANDEQQLLTIEQEWCGAYLHGDADYLERLLIDDFVFTNGRAETNNKAQELQETRDRAVHYTVFENHDMTVHLHGDSAVVTGRTRLKGTIAATGKALEAEAQFTDVFARIEGRWRATAAHVSRVGGE